MADILFSGTEPFERRLHLKSGEDCSNGFRKEDIYKIHIILCIYIAQGQGQITTWRQNFDCN